jgi:predicted AAA+ superfamily ATPase
MNEELLTRIVEALERLAPPPPPQADLLATAAFVWDGQGIAAVEAFAPLDYALLTGIDAQKAALLENSRRHAAGHAAHDVLLWGARGTGKSATVAAVVGKLQGEGADIALVQSPGEALSSLPALFSLLRGAERRFILFIDDLGFDEGTSDARALRSLLQGGATARADNIRLYVTSNRRHIVPRHMSERSEERRVGKECRRLCRSRWSPYH